MKNLRSKNLLLAVSFIFLSMADAMAQVGDIETRMTGWSDNLKTVLNIGVGAFAIVGGFIVFLQYMQGNDAAQKNFVKFVIGLAIFGLVDVIATVFLLP
ncbi:hypothetical protein [Aquimarina sp. 2201CG14-23]|uniref:hypothetical protein n=1 Tax=Aquimarina mycalae TaxID=3040073 RepID=UPI00247801E3|nr:hypothetical protein [Aquimarina sp. 2201CG14-23]MDH7445842.1 hypothetical protein [Aquimarina sp. 2201CG14-23]